MARSVQPRGSSVLIPWGGAWVVRSLPPIKIMFITTTFTIEGYQITEYKGLVRGIIVRAPTIAQGIVGGLKNIIGGRIGAYTEMCEQARQQAYDSMLQHAQEVGANAIVGVRYDASEVVSKGSATEVLCYGTAVVIQKL